MGAEGARVGVVVEGAVGVEVEGVAAEGVPAGEADTDVEIMEG